MPVRRAAVLLFLGLAVRESFSFWTGHPSDFELWVRLGYAMSHGGNPYGLLPMVPGLSFANVFSYNNTATIAYLPFWPIVTGLIFMLYSATGIDNRFVYYFMLKQPVILGDIALAYLLYSYVSARKPGSTGLWALSFWLFSPFTIIISSVWGMFDSIAICFLVLSVMSVGQFRKGVWTGFAVFVKSIPVIYVLPLTLKKLVRGKDVLALVVSVGLPSVLSVATLLLMRWSVPAIGGTLSSAAGKGGASMSIWDVFFYFSYLGVPALPAGVYAALGFVWIPAVIISGLFAIVKFRTGTDYGLIQALLVCTLVFFIFKAQITEQYALYLLSLGVLDVALWHRERKHLLFATVAVAMVYLVVNNYFLVRFLSPVYPGFVDFEDTMNAMIGAARYAVNFLAGMAFTCLNVKYLADVLTGRRSS
jgi:hypothetical protein